MTWLRNVKLIAAFATLYVVWGTTYLTIRIGLQAGLPPTSLSLRPLRRDRPKARS